MSPDLNILAARLNALGNPTRLAVYRLLVRAGDPGLPVGALHAALDLPASTLSHHLAHLVRVGLATQTRHGTTLTCRADLSLMLAILDDLRAECCADQADPP